MSKELDELKEGIVAHHYALMDAPFFGWSKEFIAGFEEALKRFERDIAKVERGEKLVEKIGY